MNKVCIYCQQFKEISPGNSMCDICKLNLLKKRTWSEKIFDAGKIMGVEKLEHTENYQEFKKELTDTKDFLEAHKDDKEWQDFNNATGGEEPPF